MCSMGFASTSVASTLDSFLLTTSALNAGVRTYKCYFIFKTQILNKIILCVSTNMI